MTAIIIFLFSVGYVLIAIEDVIKLNKTATALLTGVLCWTVYSLSGFDTVSESLSHHLASITEILFFLLGAMTIVELIDAHDGFDIITNQIQTQNPRILLWLIALIAFILSAVLDNLTTAIVMVSLLRKLISDAHLRRPMAAMVIIAANAGGAWSPIGDVTTTMLWIGGQITTVAIISKVFLPSLISLLVPLLIIQKNISTKILAQKEVLISSAVANTHKTTMLIFGVGGLLFVPLFKTLTNLPPYMGMMLVLGVIWAISEILHKDKDTEDRKVLTAAYALSRIDTSSILFFFGILLAIAALESVHILSNLATALNQTIANLNIIVVLIGLASAVIDNVPLVAASIGMYDLSSYPVNHSLWLFLAYCAGTGGSILIIGSAAGVAVMGMERIGFGWYMRKISFAALLGYLAGAGLYLILN